MQALEACRRRARATARAAGPSRRCAMTGVELAALDRAGPALSPSGRTASSRYRSRRRRPCAPAPSAAGGLCWRGAAGSAAKSGRTGSSVLRARPDAAGKAKGRHDQDAAGRRRMRHKRLSAWPRARSLRTHLDARHRLGDRARSAGLEVGGQHVQPAGNDGAGGADDEQKPEQGSACGDPVPTALVTLQGGAIMTCTRRRSKVRRPQAPRTNPRRMIKPHSVPAVPATAATRSLWSSDRFGRDRKRSRCQTPQSVQRDPRCPRAALDRARRPDGLRQVGRRPAAGRAARPAVRRCRRGDREGGRQDASTTSSPTTASRISATASAR